MRANLVWYFWSFSGRINRQEFWLGYIGLVVVALLVMRPLQTIVFSSLRPRSGPWDRDALEFALALPKLILPMMMLWPFAAIFVKRMHDINLAAWWLLLVPVAAVATSAVQGGWNFPLWISLGILGLVPGTRGINRFGD
jgi:uncharacterized membrane protein YhaH (DUF805 family)